MYFKVALFISGILIFSGCSNPFGPKPKKPKANNKNLGVEVVEVVSESKESTKELANSSVKKKINANSSSGKKVKKIKQKLKPEPFSLESQEEDPELLGPQTTLNKPLARNEQEQSEDTSDKNNTN
jgi:Fe2+ transport system protein B